MPVFLLTLHPTYYREGFFNVTREFDELVGQHNSSARLLLDDGRTVTETEARIDRKANKNGTARVMGRAPLRDWFQANFGAEDVVAVRLDGSETMRLGRSART